MGAEVLVGTIVRPRGKRCRIVAKGRERETAGEKEKKVSICLIQEVDTRPILDPSRCFKYKVINNCNAKKKKRIMIHSP